MFRDYVHRQLKSLRLREVASNSGLRRAAAVLAAALLVAPLSDAQQRNLGAGNVGNTRNAGGRVGGGAAPAPTARKTKLPGALSATNVPLPSNLMDFVSDFDAAVRLGKAFFWDVQVGSDNLTACASCHWHAGADARAKNQLHPGHDTAFATLQTGGGGVNYTVKSGDFPFNERADPNDHDTPLIRSINDRLGSAGVTNRNFTSVTTNALTPDRGAVIPDPVFSVTGLNVAQVTGRNSPTVINSVFNVRSFWDGRAQEKFNGVNIWGDLDTSAKVLEFSNGTLAEKRILLDKAALASQAVGPVLSSVEMSWAGRSWPLVGRKMLGAMPLRDQFIDPTDVHLGQFSVHPAKGMTANTTYATMIAAAFHPRWHAGGAMVFSDGFTQMERNFSLYWGIAILCYESQLVSDQAPFDRYVSGDSSAMTSQQLEGMNIFNSGGAGCSACHAGSEFAGATWSQIAQEGIVEFMATVGSQAFDELLFTTFPDFSLNLLSFDPRGSQIQILTPGGQIVAFGNIPGSSANCNPEDLEVILQPGPAAPVIPPGVESTFEAAVAVVSHGTSLPSGLCHVDLTVLMEWGNAHSLPAGLYPVVVNGTQIGALNMGTAQPDGIYDVGYYNLGARPTLEDIGGGADGPFGPLSISKRLQQGDPTVAQWMPNGGVSPSAYAIVNGTFKTPSLRNIALTGPYFHNGGAGTLEQVIQFYARGSDFAEINAQDLDADVDGVGQIRNKASKQAALTAFLAEALLDPRVATRSGVFCTPSLPLKDGYDGNELFVVDNGNGEAVPTINELPQTGAAGGPAFRPFADLLAGGVNVTHDPIVRVEEDALEGCGPLAKPSDSSRSVLIYLTNRPTSTVTIDLSVSDPNEIEIVQSQLVFTTSDWFHPHEIKVKGVKDGVIDGTTTVTLITSNTQSSDPRYDGLTVADVTIQVVDKTSQDGHIFVDASSSAQFRNGSSSRPFLRVTDALSCAPDGAVIHVAPGTYYENALVQGRHVTIEGYGATINGGMSGSCVTIFGAATHGTVLRGLSLVNGGGQNSQAGALFVSDSTSATVEECVISDSSGQRGGGIFVRNSSHLVVVDTVIERNIGQQQAGGLLIEGGSLSLTDTIVRHNSTNGEGGGVVVMNSAQLAVDGVEILHNSAGQRAGGLFLNGGSANIYDLTVSFNSAQQQVGGMLVINSVNVDAKGIKVTNNTVQNGGVGGLFVDGGWLKLNHATLATNSGADLFLMNSVNLDIKNSIIWGSGQGDAVASNIQESLPGSIQFSIIDWGGFSSQTYLRVNPLFVNAATGNHNVQSGSPAVDSGAPGELDPDGSRCDMGAHEIIGN